MRLLKAVLAGFFVVVVGFVTAAVIAASAVVIVVGRWLKGSGAGARGRELSGDAVGSGRGRATRETGDVIDISATEVSPGPSSR